ncbi:MAG: hypothetical protein U0235_00755 [Polyangiaceae bacterium]
MRRAICFLLVLLAGLALLAAVGYLAMANITRSWFEADMELRSRRGFSAGGSLARRWSRGGRELAETLATSLGDEHHGRGSVLTTASYRIHGGILPPLLSCSALERGLDSGPRSTERATA